MLIRALSVLLVGSVGLVAQEPWLPPVTTEEKAPKTSDHNGTHFLEGGFSRNDGKAGSPRNAWDVGLDTRIPNRWNDQLVSNLNARVDWDGNSGPDPSTTSITLREAYLGWHPAEAWTLDAGRMQVRDGVALGFNPTDAFRRDAIPVMRTQDFNRLRESRLGMVGLRAQYLKDGRGAVLVVAPELGEPLEDPRWFDLRLNNTNAVSRWYLKVMPGSLGAGYANVILSGSESGSRLAGLNLSTNLGNATVAYLEAAETRRMPEEGGNGRWAQQLATGCTYTTAWRQSLTLEYRFNGMLPGALSRQDNYLALWLQAQRWQEPAMRDSALVHLNWDRFLSDFVTLQAFWQQDLRESTHLAWAEWAYRRSHASFSFNVSHQSGEPRTAYGIQRQNWAANLILRIYF